MDRPRLPALMLAFPHENTGWQRTTIGPDIKVTRWKIQADTTTEIIVGSEWLKYYGLGRITDMEQEKKKSNDSRVKDPVQHDDFIWKNKTWPRRCGEIEEEVANSQ